MLILTACLVVGWLLGVLWMTPAKSEEMSITERCITLAALQSRYQGIALEPDEKAVKAQLVKWYNKNCKKGKNAR